MNNVNRQWNYMYDLEEKYRIDYIENNKFDRLLSAIKVIEMNNRNFLWRILEYFFLIYELSIFRFSNKISNISIGPTQLKISIILDYSKIKYYKVGKKIILVDRISIFKLFKTLINVNEFNVMKSYILNILGKSSIDDLSQNEILDIALKYSGNIEFTEKLNYYSVLCYLYFEVYNNLKSFS